MTVDEILLDTAERFSDKTVMIHDRTRLSSGELCSLALRLAYALRSCGVRRGDRIIIALENSLEYLVAYFGVILSRGVPVAINPDIKRAGLQGIVMDCTPTGIISRSAALPVIQKAFDNSCPFRFVMSCDRRDENQQADPRILYLDECLNYGKESFSTLDRRDDVLASIIYTSGTTGEPKGVMLSHRNLLSNAASIVSYLELTSNDSVMVVLPFYYSYGNSLLLTHIMQGGTLVIDNRFMYANVVLDTIIRESVTGFAGVPSTFAILLNRSNFRHMSFPSLRYITQAGGPMPHDMAIEITRIVPHTKLYIMYGQTEATARLSYLPPDDLLRKHGSVGKGIPGVSLEVRNEHGEKVKPGEVGEVRAKGDNIMLGYWGKEEDTGKVLSDGWLLTGDTATIDNEDYIYILGRRTEMIKSGAHRIAPREIEDILLKYTKIAEAAVIGEPDTILGEAISAFIVVKEGLSCQEKEILQYCHENLPVYKMPRTIHFVSSLPRTDSGKIKKGELKKVFTCEVNQ
ncbi:MAG: acyl--CoA ligase [Nitrospirae bacterium]|nr:acyl--CoA ligase [Nitrospirota bacterium]